jgi:hypothetical protein
MAEVERLARVAYVAYMEEAGDADRTNWEAEPSLYRALWQRVVEAVLAEQAAPAGPRGMDHAQKMRDHAVRELKEGLADINRAFVYRDALEQELAEIEARWKGGVRR